MQKKPVKPIKHAVVLVNYNGWADTAVCLKSIQQAKDAPHVIVVDNNSQDESVVKLREAFPGLDLISSQVNLGFSGGNNLGIKKALRLGAKVVYILNNDTTVDPNLFYRAYRYVEGKNRIAGGKIYYAKGYEYHATQKDKGNILWYAGGYMDWSMAVSRHRGVDEVDQGQYDKIQDTDFISGCFMAIPRRVINKLGVFDERFFLYLEDSDYCQRAQNSGIELKYNPALILYHRNSSSTGPGSPLVDYYMTRNRLLIGRKSKRFRLYFALLREALLNLHSPIRRLAFYDYLAGRMGNRNEAIFKITPK